MAVKRKKPKKLKTELLLKAYLEKGGTIKQCPPAYAHYWRTFWVENDKGLY